MKKLFSRGKGKIFVIIAVGLAILMLISLLASSVFSARGGTIWTGSGEVVSTTELSRGQRSEDYALLYVQDGLTACYMGYTDEGLTRQWSQGNIVYSWKNYVQGGKEALLTVGANAKNVDYHIWQRMNGGIGYVVREANRETVKGVGLFIPYSLTLEDMPSYEMYCVATFLGMTTRAGYGEDAEPIYYTTDQMPLGVPSYETASPFRLGVLHSFNYLTLHEKASYSYCNRWYLSNQSFLGHQHMPSYRCEILQYEYDKGFDFRLGGHMATDAWKNPITWSVMRSNYTDVSQNQKVMYGIRYTYAGTDLIPDFVASYDRSRIAELEAYEDGYVDQVGDFSLFNEYGCVIYSVRLYDRALTEEEAYRNAFVDLLAFYSVNVNFMSHMSGAELDGFLTDCGELASVRGIAMDVDATHAAANRAQIYDIINEVMN